MDSLLEGVARSFQDYESRPALFLGDQAFTCGELSRFASAIAHLIATESPTPGRVAILSECSLTAYGGILGALMAGAAYVPIHPGFPAARAAQILLRSQATVLLVGPDAVTEAKALLELVDAPRIVITPEISEARRKIAAPGHSYLDATDLAAQPTTGLTAPTVAPSDIAYLLFTSGSTGEPKAVPVSHGNACAYLQVALSRYDLTPEDRASQTFRLAFDLSVHDLFVTWSRGASLHPLPPQARLLPGRFIRERELTHWFSVPTTAMTMARFGQLSVGAFPSLRASLFCGEALPLKTARQWAIAAPHSTVDNLYGPTEATIAFTSYRWHPGSPDRSCRNGVVPLGQAFPDQETFVLGEGGRRADPGQPGELLLSGSQLTSGYWQAPELTDQRFIRLQETGDQIWYRTGDIVERDQSGCLHFLGRCDDQIQLQGHRVELAEIDDALRRACGHELAVSVAWPGGPEEVGGVVGFVACDAPLDTEDILAKCRRTLPDYMIPSRIIGMEHLPKNNSGKLDRKALQKMLDDQEV